MCQKESKKSQVLIKRILSLYKRNEKNYKMSIVIPELKMCLKTFLYT